MIRAERLPGNPIVTRGMTARVGDNVNGPSLIRVPEWVEAPLGRYYLYFAHHLGRFIRLAVADDLAGPWRVHDPGVLDLEEVPSLHDHIASPDVHVDEAARRIRMYFHGVSDPEAEGEPPQETCLAISGDGLTFDVESTLLGESYFRVWQDGPWAYAVSLGGWLWRSADGTRPFERGPRLAGLPEGTRHLAVMRKGRALWVAWSAIGDCPERIFVGRVDLEQDWQAWRLTQVQELLRPEESWEGAGCPLVASEVGMVTGPAHQLRDPAFFSEDGADYLLYSVAGEAGLAMARLHWKEGHA